MKTIGLMDIRSALHDHRFQSLFPELKREIDKYIADPKCGSCAVPVSKEILIKYSDRVEKYFPGRKVILAEEDKKTSENNFYVVNCHIDELEGKMRKLGPGKKQLAICRWEDQVTVVINELTIN